MGPLDSHGHEREKGGHAWFVWRRDLAEFLPLIFIDQG
jgi:hypothetical protein